jgi:chemotaxis methyl-accepting protein methylase
LLATDIESVCRNLAFMYFDTALQGDVLARLAHAIAPDGVLVLGAHETLPVGERWFAAWSPASSVCRRTSLPTPDRAITAP